MSDRLAGVDHQLRVVHLPVYTDNAYQPLLMAALRRQGAEVIDGGGGGNFIGIALRRWKADVIHFHWLHPYMLRSSRLGSLGRGLRFLAEVVALRVAGTRIVWTVHNLQNHARHQVGLERWFTRRFVRLVHQAIAHCSAGRAVAEAAFGLKDPARWAVIPHGSYVGHYADTVSRSDARRSLGLADGELVLLFLGRILPYKGILELVQEFRTHAPSDARLVIAGKPGDESSLPTIADAAAGHPGIRLHPGYVPDDQVQTFMRAADVVVQPFRDILTSSSVVLAMSFGKAVVAPARGCIPDTLGPDGGIVYPPDDPQGLGNALFEVYRRRNELTAMGEANRRRTEEWTWDRVAAETVRVYDEVLGRRGT
jgi:glycosyltransferase involved in cell wall biosynthesis